MGLTATDIDLLIELQARKLLTRRIVTIGSLSLYLHPWQLRLLRQIMPGSEALNGYCWGDNADAILREMFMGASITSIDVSRYQDSTIMHDMNLPMSKHRPDLEGQFDIVIDGGTLEHILHFPIAAANLMFLVREGGHILTANPANNLCGHGFYQFTPELMYRLYAPSNGFSVRRVILTECRHLSVEMDPRPRSWKVADPATLRRRILLRNRWPVMIRTLAERTGNPLALPMAQQSDYVAAWSDSATPRPRSRLRSELRKIFDRLPLRMQARITDYLSHPNFGNREAMQRWRGRLN